MAMPYAPTVGYGIKREKHFGTHHHLETWKHTVVLFSMLVTANFLHPLSRDLEHLASALFSAKR